MLVLILVAGVGARRTGRRERPYLAVRGRLGTLTLALGTRYARMERAR
jgi:hypothetical protein